jgi:hypothetical protein
MFTQTLTTTPHLFLSEFFGMVYEHFLGCFILEDPSSRFSKLIQVVVIVVWGDILRSVALVLGANKLLAMAKDIDNLHPVVVSEMFLRLISCSIVLQLQGPF